LAEPSFAGGGFDELLLAGPALLLALLLLARLPDEFFAVGGGGAESALFWGGDGGGDAAEESRRVFWWTRPAKRSLAGGAPVRVDAGAAWKAALAAAAESGVALTTDDLRKKLTREVSKYRASRYSCKYTCYFNYL
jgi:hypothetical protein